MKIAKVDLGPLVPTRYVVHWGRYVIWITFWYIIPSIEIKEV